MTSKQQVVQKFSTAKRIISKGNYLIAVQVGEELYYIGRAYSEYRAWTNAMKNLGMKVKYKR